MQRAALAETGADFDAVGTFDAVDDLDVRAVRDKELDGLLRFVGDAVHQLAGEALDVLAGEGQAAQLLHGGAEAVAALAVLGDEAAPHEGADEAKGGRAVDRQYGRELRERKGRLVSEGEEQAQGAIERLDGAVTGSGSPHRVCFVKAAQSVRIMHSACD